MDSIDAEIYVEQIHRKRDFWRTRRVRLLETSVSDLRGDRAQFEVVLKYKLEAAGIPCVKLPDAKLFELMWRRQRDSISHAFLQFINRSKKLGLPSEQLQQRIADRPVSQRHRKFWELGLVVLAEYEAIMQSRHQMDFEDLLAQAIARIEASCGECSYGGGSGSQHSVKLNELRWLLLDEFQDFSPKLYQLIGAMRRYNPQLKIFCVGDDWQAINGFAGASTTFLLDFAKWFPNGASAHLLYNRRSAREIVEAGNKLMAKYPPPAKVYKHKQFGEIKVTSLDKVEFNPKGENSLDRAYMFEQLAFDNDYAAARTLKVAHHIAGHKAAAGKKIVVLSRTERLHNVLLADYERKLHKLLGGRGDIHFSTIHKYKGLEADFVVLANVCEYTAPLIHPDNLLQSIFYDSEKAAWDEALEEELRLFYVALSRAKKRISILTMTGEESRFLQLAGLHV
jgi:DNA helicase-4